MDGRRAVIGHEAAGFGGAQQRLCRVVAVKFACTDESAEMVGGEIERLITTASVGARDPLDLASNRRLHVAASVGRTCS